MTTNWQELARTTLEGSESGAITFAQSVRMPGGESVELETERTPAPVAECFDAAVIKEALREAQAPVPGYTYKGFCAKVAAAGCAGYLVSFTGKRVLYYGRIGETHTEYFPGDTAGGEAMNAAGILVGGVAPSSSAPAQC